MALSLIDRFSPGGFEYHPSSPSALFSPSTPTVIVDDSISLPASATFLLIFLLYSLPPLFYLTFFKKKQKTFFYSPSSAKALKLSYDSGFPWFCYDTQDKEVFHSWLNVSREPVNFLLVRISGEDSSSVP